MSDDTSELTFVAGLLPRDARKINGGKYSKIELDDETIERGAYKKYLGGGAEKWESRGLFQLSLLRTAGMLPSSRLLDVGCGPIRAGVHFISFLNAGNYYGVDYNNSFIKAASLLVAEKGLSGQHPTLRVVSDFDFSALNQQFDFVNVFSVLNHCDDNSGGFSSRTSAIFWHRTRGFL